MTVLSKFGGRKVITGLVVVVGALLIIILSARRQDQKEMPSAFVESGTFVISLTETGELRATKSVTVSAPRVGNWSARPQIVELIPEGTTVAKDSFLAQFDPSALDKTIEQKQAELEISRADFSRVKAVNAATMQDLRSNLANVRAGHELAKLQLEQMQFEAEVKKREQELQLERSANDVLRAETKLTSQETINAQDVRKLTLRVSQAESELEKALRDRESLTLMAPMAGLVVYPKVWSGGSRPKKVQEGDTPWPGQPIIELPDLSEMEVLTEVTEVDVSKVELDQMAEIRLDAFGESLFVGKVTSVGTLAKEKDEDNPAKVFEVTVLIENSSPILRPGMTASTKIIIDELENQLWMPIDAVFTADDTTIAYVLDGEKMRKTSIILGPKNDNYVVIEAGLDYGQEVGLVAPGSEMRGITTKPAERAKKKEGGSNAGRPRHGVRRRG